MIELKNISKTYRTSAVPVAALREASLKIGQGEFVAIMGPSGSGKSTLLHILGFLDRPDEGSYLFNGEDVSKLSDDQLAHFRNRVAGFVFQQFYLLSRMSAKTNVGLPMIYGGRHLNEETVLEKIAQVGLSGRAGHMPNELSGGEQQRVAIARALVNDPYVIFADEPTGNLDSKSQKEIMEILKGLNDSGKTIVMVTHDSEVAAYAKRVINVRDGNIVSDELNGGSGRNAKGKAEKAKTKSIPQYKTFSITAGILENLRQAVVSAISHKMRSTLSILGILIGVAAIISMLALGRGAKDAISERLSKLGSNLLMIESGAHNFHGVSLGAGAVTRLTTADTQAISKLPGIKRSCGYVSGQGQLVYGDKNWKTQVMGTCSEYAVMRASVPVTGRFFHEDELVKREKVAVIGMTVLKELFGTEDPIGKTIKINKIYFTVIGVLPEQGSAQWRDRDDVVIIPLSTAMYRLLGVDYVDHIDAEALDAGQMDAASASIKKLLNKRHKVDVNDEEAIEIRNMVDIQETIKSTSDTISTLLGIIAAISLLVGGIGIMNIMLVSVTERTREIGLRKAIGARGTDIMRQFLIESVFMTLTGGLIGVIIGSLIAFGLGVFAGWSVKVSEFSVILACGFSVVVGLVFGIWPAKKASKLNPIEALRYE